MYNMILFLIIITRLCFIDIYDYRRWPGKFTQPQIIVYLVLKIFSKQTIEALPAMTVNPIIDLHTIITI